MGGARAGPLHPHLCRRLPHAAHQAPPAGQRSWQQRQQQAGASQQCNGAALPPHFALAACFVCCRCPAISGRPTHISPCPSPHTQQEFNLYDEGRLHTINMRQPFQLGPFECTPIRVTHSIPDCCGLVLRSDHGTIVHTGAGCGAAGGDAAQHGQRTQQRRPWRHEAAAAWSLTPAASCAAAAHLLQATGRLTRTRWMARCLTAKCSTPWVRPAAGLVALLLRCWSGCCWCRAACCYALGRGGQLLPAATVLAVAARCTAEWGEDTHSPQTCSEGAWWRPLETQ